MRILNITSDMNSSDLTYLFHIESVSVDYDVCREFHELFMVSIRRIMFFQTKNLFYSENCGKYFEFCGCAKK